MGGTTTEKKETEMGGTSTEQTETDVTLRDHECSLQILRCSENQDSAQNACKILVGSRLLVLPYFYKYSHL